MSVDGGGVMFRASLHPHGYVRTREVVRGLRAVAVRSRRPVSFI